MLDYIRCMTINQNVDPGVYKRLSSQNYEDISNYINAPMTATTFSDKNHRSSREIITADRLFALIKVCSIKNAPSKKMGKRDILSQNHALNMARRNALGSRG